MILHFMTQSDGDREEDHLRGALPIKLPVLIEIPVARAVLRKLGDEYGRKALALLEREAERDQRAQGCEMCSEACDAPIQTWHEPNAIAVKAAMRIHEEPGTPRSIFWENESLVLYGRTIPAAIAQGLKGRPVDDLLTGVPLLEGLALKEVEADEALHWVTAGVRDALAPIHRFITGEMR